eukprot:8960276-Pyramimonas_sp.AAC.1
MQSSIAMAVANLASSRHERPRRTMRPGSSWRRTAHRHTSRARAAGGSARAAGSPASKCAGAAH